MHDDVVLVTDARGREVWMTNCPDCGSIHMGGRCRMNFRERMASIAIDPAVLESRTRHDYFDSGPIDQIFGEDSREQMLEQTDGHGYALPDERGDLWSRNPKTKEVERVDDELLDRIWLGGDLEHEAG